MNKYFFLSYFMLLAICIGQIDYNFSYEAKYGKGKQVDEQSEQSEAIKYGYNEHLIDMNVYFENGLYFYSSLEYSNPPVLGPSRTGFSSTNSSFSHSFIEYEGERLYARLGNIVALYGRGLALGVQYDQTIDFDNSLEGLEVSYDFNDYLKVFGLGSKSIFKYRKKASDRIRSMEIPLKVQVGGINYASDMLGDFQFFFLNETQELKNILNDYVENGGDNSLTSDLDDRFFLNPENPADLIDYIGGEFDDSDKLNHLSYDVNHFFTFYGFDFFYELVFLRYDKMLSDDYESTINKYFSIYREFSGFGLTYEFKDYFSPYRVKTIFSPPTVFKESTSVLLSRNQHSIDFLNESGHQIEVNKSFSSSLNTIINASFSSKYADDVSTNRPSRSNQINFLDLIISDVDDVENKRFNPYSQVYFEMNGWVLDQHLYYKTSLDLFKQSSETKSIWAFTIPSHFIYDFKNNISVNIYAEYQKKEENSGIPIYYDLYYASATLNLKKWHFSYFRDAENKRIGKGEGKGKSWTGCDLSWNFNSSSMVSIFYGSQKGGLVCANGVCAVQPAFKQGVKVTLRTSF